MTSLLYYLKVYKFDNKIRLGVKSDGGYVIGDISGNYDCYISAGVSDEESFSRDFINKYNMNEENCFAFDGTIQNYPYQYTNKITFIKKNISFKKTSNTSNLSYFIEKYNNIFLKMDIEGGEYLWLSSLNNDSLKKFKQIVIEFHGINDDSFGINYYDKSKCIKKLYKTHYLIHIHGNNCCATTNNIPNVVELTYIRKDYFTSIPNLNTTSLPIPDLDFPNIDNFDDLLLNFEPFVFS